jgi:hypothetical protein
MRDSKETNKNKSQTVLGVVTFNTYTGHVVLQ